MIRKFLFVALTFLAAFTVQAQDRATLLTADGTVYSIRSDYASNHTVAATSGKLLELTIQNGVENTVTYVPASLTGSWHETASLAYDEATKTLFVFWQHRPTRFESELLFSSYRDGTWSEPTVFEKEVFRVRFNLRIAVTAEIGTRAEDGTITTAPATTIHAIWWEQTGTEKARYASFLMNNGVVVSTRVHDLLEFVPAEERGAAVTIPADYNLDLFRNPAMIEQPSHDAIDVVFADWTTSSFHSLTLRPIQFNGVLDVPIGVGNGRTPMPQTFSATSAMTAGGISTLFGDDGTLAFSFEGEGKLQYILYREGVWSDVRAITLNERVSRDSGMNALRRLVGAN